MPHDEKSPNTTGSLWAKSSNRTGTGLEHIVVRDLTPTEADKARKSASEAMRTSPFVETVSPENLRRPLR